MHFSTRFGMGVSLGGMATTYLSTLVAQATPDAASAAAPIASGTTWAVAAVTIAGSLTTIVTVITNVFNNKKRIEELEALRKRDRVRMLRLKKGLKTTRKNRHDERDKWSTMFGELRIHDMDIAAAVNTVSQNQAKVIEHLKIPGTVPVPRVDVLPVAPSPSPVVPPTPVPPMVYLSPPEPPKG